MSTKRAVVILLLVALLGHACKAQTSEEVDGVDATEIVLSLPKISAANGAFSVFSPKTLESKRIASSLRQVTLKKGEWLEFTQEDGHQPNADWLKALAEVASRLWTVVFTNLTDDDALHAEKLVELRRFAVTLDPSAKATGLAVLSKLPKLNFVALELQDAQVQTALKHTVAVKTLSALLLRLGDKVSVDVLDALKDHPSLSAMMLSNWKGLTDAGLAKLAKIPKLTGLDVQGCTKITGEGLAAFKGSQLDKLNLNWCERVGDAGAKHIATMTKLVDLRLGGAGLTDAGLKALAPLEKLEFLELGNSFDITDAGIKEVAAFKNLRMLGLAGLDITDECMETLKSLSKLELLNVASTKLSKNGIAALKKALPKTRIRDR
ncbi:hypothetical protein PLCT2_02567 [Planctomycetaceae bacterium]|nr:hypothetical protein PLCT2_02567 [Planctomycetaceae bacterium]